MALASPSSAETLQLKLEKSDTEIPMITSIALPSLLSTADLSSGSAPAAAATAAAPLESPNPNTNPNPPNPTPTVYSNSGAGLKATPALIIPPAPPAVPSFTPSFRPFVVLSTPQYTTVPNPSIQPPGVSAPIVSVNPMMPGTVYQAPLAYSSNGYVSVPAPAPHAIPPPVDHV